MMNNISEIINELHTSDERSIIRYIDANNEGEIRFIKAKDYSRDLVYTPQDITTETQSAYGDLAIKYLDKFLEGVIDILPRLTKTVGFLNEELVIGVIDEYQITTHIAVPILPLVRELYPEIGKVIDQQTHHPILSRHIARLKESLLLDIAHHGKQQEFECRLNNRIRRKRPAVDFPWSASIISEEEHLVLNLVFGLEEVLQSDY